MGGTADSPTLSTAGTWRRATQGGERRRMRRGVTERSIPKIEKRAFGKWRQENDFRTGNQCLNRHGRHCRDDPRNEVIKIPSVCCNRPACDCPRAIFRQSKSAGQTHVPTLRWYCSLTANTESEGSTSKWTVLLQGVSAKIQICTPRLQICTPRACTPRLSGLVEAAVQENKTTTYTA